MKRRNFWAANLVLIATLLSSGQSRAEVNAGQLELTAANAGFAFDLMQQIAAEQPGTDIFISPYSVSTVLQMVSTGAAGTTKTQMQQMLGTFDIKPVALNEANKVLGSIIDSRNTNFLLTTANAVWYRSGMMIEPPFIQGDEQYFGAKVEGLNFNNPAAADIINAWAAQETHGKIDRIVSPPIDPAVQMFLANAVYFLGNWELPFDTNNTRGRVFYLSDGGQETIPMMEQTATFSCCQGNGYQAVRLPYKGGDLAMYVFLPSPDSSVQELLSTMNGAWWQQTIQADFVEQEAVVVLPKFDLNYNVDLVPPLEALGMTTAFTQNADFSGISRQPLAISAVKQQAVVEVDEKGTEAAAVTTVTVVATVATPPPPLQIIMDRPFLFFIEDQQAGTILFMGAVFNP
jgi:serine protease inhibitor